MMIFLAMETSFRSYKMCPLPGKRLSAPSGKVVCRPCTANGPGRQNRHLPQLTQKYSQLVYLLFVKCAK